MKDVFKANADVVYGSRFLGRNAHRILFFGIPFKIQSLPEYIYLETVDIFSKTDSFIFWQYLRLKTHLRGDILVIDREIGNISKRILTDFDRVSLSDMHASYRGIL